MAINFPDSPTNGDSFVTGGITYTWDGSSWSAAGSGVTITATETDTLQSVTDRGASSSNSITLTNILYLDSELRMASSGFRIIPNNPSFGTHTLGNISGTGGIVFRCGQSSSISFTNENGTNTFASISAATGLTAGGLTYPITNGTSGQVLTSDGAGNVTWGSGGGGGATVAGSDTQVQYNDNGSLGASAALTFSDPGGLPATRRLQVGDDPGNPSQNFVGEILTDNLNAQGSISALAGGYFGNSVQIEGNQPGTQLQLFAGSDPVAISDNNFSTGTAGQVLTATGDDGSGNATGVAWSTSSGLAGRQTASATTASIGNNVSANLTIAAAKTYALLKIQTSAAAWVTLYTDTASRTADAGRTENTDALPGSGVIAEVITNGAATQLMTPGVFGFNNDATPSTNVYVKVVNKSGSNAAITVTLTYTILEV